MGKWKKKLRKFAKKAAPIAMLALGAAALAKRRKAKALNAITDYGDTGTLSGKAGFEGDVPSAPAATKGLGKTDKVYIDPLITGDQGTTIYRGSGKELSDSGQTIGAAGVNAQGLSRGQLAQNMAAKAKAKAKANASKDIVPIQRIGTGPRRFKHGGRVGVGKAKRGFGRALRKK